MGTPLPPVVLVLGGHDPTGGAGIIADSETIAACGGWAFTIPTALTVQNCRNVSQVMPVAPALIHAMVEALKDMEIAAIKVGLIADYATLQAVETVIRGFPGIPVVVDPVLKAGGGAELSTEGLIDNFCQRLLPLVDILTPNRLELARLTPEIQNVNDDTARAVALIRQGCQAVLVTGTDDPIPGSEGEVVTHTLHAPETTRQWQWPRLEGSFHGSGCTLAAALAARLAVGERLPMACEQAQRFTWQALSQGYRPSQGQSLPCRLHREG
ncbi:hydroxymethylpyrimidine/phosphomethylpyrimidine kinase [Halomonas sediminis]